MISALLADQEARAAKESSKEASQALKDLRSTYNAWKTQIKQQSMPRTLQSGNWSALHFPQALENQRSQHSQSVRTLQHDLGLLASERNQHSNK